MNGFRTLNAVLSLNVALSLNAVAVPHINPEAYPGTKQCRTRPLSAAKISAAGGNYRKALIINASTPKKIAVILVNFPSADGTFTSGNETITNNAAVQGYFDHLEAFYLENSY